VVAKYKFDLNTEQWDTLYKFASEEFQKAENCTRKIGGGTFHGAEIGWVKENPLNERPELAFAKNLFLEAICHYFTVVHDTEIPQGVDFKISDSWFLTARDLGMDQPHFYTAIHNHAFSICSGVFYMDDSEHGTTMFSDFRKPPHWPFVWGGKNSKQNVDSKLIKSEKGTLILFPAETDHSSTIVRGAKDRRTLIFNVWPQGKISDQDNARLMTQNDPLADSRIFGKKLASLEDFQGSTD